MEATLKTVLFAASVALIVSNARVLAHTDVTPEEARDLIDATENLVVVDVRERSEYCDAVGHIPGALNYPLTSGVLQDRFEELAMDRPILVVCRSGGRSNQAATFLDDQGFGEVYDMTGGMNAWLWETVPCKYAGGSGTSDDPYQIATAEDLMLLGETPDDHDSDFILTADIDLDPNLPGRKVFERAVIDSLRGGFDGDGHVIAHLTIRGDSNLGLFKRLQDGASISNLGMEAVDVNGTGDYIGGLVGYNRIGNITMSYSTGTIVGDEYVGGLVGESADAGSIATSYSTATVGGNRDIGGLMGRNFGSISTCWSAGAVSGANRHIGGLVGANEGSIAASYSTATVSGGSSVGGLVGVTGQGEDASIAMSYSTGAVGGGNGVGGLVGENAGSIASGFWDVETSGQATSAGGTGLTTLPMQDINAYLEAGWDFVDEIENGAEDLWRMDEGQGYPRLWWEFPAEDPNGMGVPEWVLPVHRLWSETYVTYFYTIDEAEKDEWLGDSQGAWEYQGVAFYAFAGDDESGLVPVYRFYSESLRSYFYTTGEGEKDWLIEAFPDVWRYDGVAFYVFAEMDRSDTSPVHRFWSPSLTCHFYTIDEDEKTEFALERSDVWVYETVIGYAYSDPVPATSISDLVSDTEIDRGAGLSAAVVGRR